MRRTLTIIAATAAAAALCGCVYRPTIQQGNLLQLDEIDQVKVGMTRSQVRYILGTPMVSDPFEPDRWDYVYTLQQGRDKHIDRAHFVVLFEGDKVSEVDKLDLPEESDVAKRVRAGARQAGRRRGQGRARRRLRRTGRSRRRPRPQRLRRPRRARAPSTRRHRRRPAAADRQAAPRRPAAGRRVSAASNCSRPSRIVLALARPACASPRVDRPLSGR